MPRTPCSIVTAEPTDMLIGYGEFLTGDNCVISGGGEVDLFRFDAAAGDYVLLSLGDGSPSLVRRTRVLRSEALRMRSWSRTVVPQTTASAGRSLRPPSPDAI